MKSASVFFAILAGGVVLSALAQLPQGVRLKRSSMPSYRHTAAGNKLDFVITSSSFSNLNARTLLVNQFELTSFRNGDSKQTNVIAKAPHCAVDVSNSVASDPGPLEIFTPTTNLFTQGVGFVFTQANHLLIISNQVETRVIKSILKTSLLAAPRTNADETTPQILKIFADRGQFDFDSNIVDYAGNVHLIDPQLDMTSDLLTIRFTTNGTVKSILARQNVVLTTTNNGRATGEVGYYYLTNGTEEMMQLTNNASWRNGDQSARAQEFIYDPTRHLLTGVGKVKVRWPSQATNPAEHPPGSVITQAGANGFRELFADSATVQFPLTNGPAQHMHARGNVIIVNDADQSKAMAEQADYDRDTDHIELTGNPVWWNTNMEVTGQTLSADLGARTYHARTLARFKMRTHGGEANPPTAAAAVASSTNQWIFIASDDIAYQTNQAIFYRNVEVRLVNGDQLRDTLDCKLLTLDLTSNRVENAFAVGDVRGRTAADLSGMVKTISCGQLNAHLSVTTGLVKTIDAMTNVVIEEKGTAKDAPQNNLMADTVNARFSPVTNRIEVATAEGNVSFDQFKAGKTTHATAWHGIYTADDDIVKLTGNPLAHSDTYLITDADFMIWQPKSNRFEASGLYKIVPYKPAHGPKPL